MTIKQRERKLSSIQILMKDIMIADQEIKVEQGHLFKMRLKRGPTFVITLFHLFFLETLAIEFALVKRLRFLQGVVE